MSLQRKFLDISFPVFYTENKKRGCKNAHTL